MIHELESKAMNLCLRLSLQILIKTYKNITYSMAILRRDFKLLLSIFARIGSQTGLLIGLYQI